MIRHSTLTLGIIVLLAGCAGLPEGVPAPVDDPDAPVMTLPGGRKVPVDTGTLTYTGKAGIAWPDGRHYDGDWVGGQPHGEGTEVLPDGTTYRGGWQAGQRHGQGVLESPDGDRYAGEFAAGKRNGVGTQESAEGTYRGEWSADHPEGEGVFEGDDGTRYEGSWRHGQRFGYGRFEGPDGSTYEGDWAYDQPQGSGRMESANGAIYEGTWQQGRQQGYGIAEGPPGLIYEGTWVDGEQQGFGREVRPDGSVYEGEWVGGKRSGQGREVQPDGAVHAGAWELNQPLGPGQRRTTSGVEISGMWNADVVSTGLLALPTGPEYAGPLFSDSGTEASPRLLAWLTDMAGQGDPYAQHLLGSLYLDYEQPPPDLEMAQRWLGRAAGAGIADAQFRLALTYEDTDPPRVVELLSEAAGQGHAGANETLGEYYYNGFTVPQNLNRAIDYFDQAVAAGSVMARNNLAWLLATSPDPARRDGQRAVSLIRPIALYTGAWQYLDTLAAAWAATGDFAEAATTGQMAIDAANEDPEGIAEAELAALRARLESYRAGQAFLETAPAADLQ